VHDVTRADLSRHTTLRLGGPAAQLATATHQDELVELIRQTGGTSGDAGGAGPAGKSGDAGGAGPVGEFLLLAGGSNVVIADAGVDSVILVRSTGVSVAADKSAESVLLTVEAGQPWDDVVAQCVAEGFSGIECLSGIPGSAGATPIQNVGAYGQEVAETIAAVRVLDRELDLVRDLAPAECAFAYRTSRFRGADRFVVLSVTFRLRRDPLSTPVRYAELARTLGLEPGARAPLADVRAAVLTLRAGKGMVIDPSDPDTTSAGSFFTNPVLDPPHHAALRVRADEVAKAEPPAWPGEDGTVKISAAWLIERAGFAKGYHGGHPGVAVSSKHTLALTNRGTGTTAELLALAREIRDGVAKIFDVTLHPEPVLVNCTL
jgi:UDP-N-acetylmuramate dehydrogenase